MSDPSYPQRADTRVPPDGTGRYRVNGTAPRASAPLPRGPVSPPTGPAEVPGAARAARAARAGAPAAERPADRPADGRRGRPRHGVLGRAAEVFGSRDPSPDGGARGTAPEVPGRASRLRLSVGLKLGVVVGVVMAIAAASALLLINESRITVNSYNDLLARQARQAQLVLQMQVEFKQQVQEWKDVLLRGDDPADLAKYTKQFHEADARVDALYDELLRTVDDPGLQAQLDKWHELELGTDTGYTRALQLMQDSHGQQFRAADDLVRGIDRPPTAALGEIVDGRQKAAAETAVRVEASAAERQRLTLIATVVLFVVMSLVLAVVLMRLVRPIRALTRQALLTATERLPGAIDRIRGIQSDDEAPALPPFRLRTGDELEELGEALTTLQESALGQAVGQRRAERETAEMLVNLGRRNQNLLGRMLGYVTELERREQDPDVLSQLFRLDHATTRIRRNAESMLVLAGATQTRTWSRPVPVIDVVRASLSEIEEYIRVDLHHVEDSAVNGTAVADVVHLLAELMENATHFSPPTTQVTVIGQSVREGYRLRVIDQGVGMTRRELDEANERIRRAEAGWADSKLLGLHVVGRLARRRGIRVTLEASAGRGITATVLLPVGILAGRGEAQPSAAQPGAAQPAQGTERRPAGEQPAPEAKAALVGVPTGPGGFRRPAADHVVDLTAAPDGAPETELPAARRSPYALRGRDDDTGGLAATARADAPPLAGNPYALPPAPAFPPSQPSAGAGVRRPPAVPLSPASAGPQTSPVPAHQGGGAAVAVPRRVRGAQLPDLGPADEPVVARPDDGPGAPESLRWQLRSFQLDVQAARRAIAESGDRPDQDSHRPEGQG